MRAARFVVQFGVCAVFAVSTAVLSSAQITPTRPPVEAFGGLPEVSRPSLSPDGKHIALVQPYKGRPVAVIRSLEGIGEAPFALPYDNGFIVGVFWANNDRLLVTVNLNKQVWSDTGLKPWYRTIAIGRRGETPTVLFSNMTEARDRNYSASAITGLSAEDPNVIYMPLFLPLNDNPSSDAEFRNILYQVDVTTGKAKSLVRGSWATQDWFMDGHGHVVARIDETKNPFVDHLFLYKNDDWTEVESAPMSEGLTVHGLNLDGTGLVMPKVGGENDTVGLVTRSLADGSKSPLYNNPRFDISDVLLDPWTQRVVGVTTIEDLATDRYFDPKLQALQNGLQASFPRAAVHAVTWDQAIQKVIFTVEEPRVPPAYFLLDRTKHQAVQIAATYEDLHESDLGEVKSYPYKARDGLDIPAYLTLPPGKAPKNLPVVIMPHGGPMARDHLEFDWMVQFLANRGYAVLQPNFRGSSGYGLKFQTAGYGEWGLKMQDDVTDGVKKLIGDGIADPKRICIVGWSYGGYAALAGAAFTPDLYACAAGGAGVYDLRKFLSTRAKDFGKDSALIESWTHFIGDRWDDSEKLDAASPAENAKLIKCAVLLVHGTDDATVRIDQSETMERALRRADKKVRYVPIPKETHYLMSSESRVIWLRELEKFLKENIGD
jgi:dipeptidyl aminopeptidase/acylaminoacyl peptidase